VFFITSCGLRSVSTLANQNIIKNGGLHNGRGFHNENRAKAVSLLSGAILGPGDQKIDEE